MVRQITERELREESGEIVRQLDRGECFVVMHDGVAVGELTPLRRRQFVARERVLHAFSLVPAIDPGRLRRDGDAALDQDPTPAA
jgi:antitoxin (DNA-binding transcriptional repressor) of toxin-antitoxin stability system